MYMQIWVLVLFRAVSTFQSATIKLASVSSLVAILKGIKHYTSLWEDTTITLLNKMKKGVIFNFMLLILHCRLRGTDETSYIHNLRHGRHFIGGICTKFNQALIGPNMSSLQTTGIIQCAQKCLTIHPCGAINFNVKSRWCELHKWQSKESITSVVYRKGSVFVLLYWDALNTLNSSWNCFRLHILSADRDIFSA